MMSTFSSPRLALHRFPVTAAPVGDRRGHQRPAARRVARLPHGDAPARPGSPSRSIGSRHDGSRSAANRCYPSRQLLAATWGVTVENVYATSEAGGIAGTCPEGLGLHLNDDLVLIEPVDTHGRPTPVGELSAKVYLTCLYNLDLPLIRYELDDQVRVLAQPCGCGSAMTTIEDVHGRSNDSFHYHNGVVAHPLIFSTVLGRATQVAEYQVHQREHGADVLIQPSHQPPDLAALRRDLETGLATLGLPHPAVTLRIVDHPPPNHRQDPPLRPPSLQVMFSRLLDHCSAPHRRANQRSVIELYEEWTDRR